MSASAGGIAIRGLKKRYGSTVALDGLDLDLQPGEVLGIAGPNGAGKSTLVKILAGEERADAGEFSLGGNAWSPIDSWTNVAVVHQEAQLFPNLTVGENMLVGRESVAARRPKLGEADRALMQSLGIAGVIDLPLGDCTLATQQRTEIARALARDARLFLFDEPNSALTDEESDQLFRQMRQIAEAGRIVILVTHRLSDLVAHTGRVVVIRDGRARAELAGASLSEDAIAQRLVVSTGGVETIISRQPGATGSEVLRVAGWSHASEFSDVDFSVAGGEIVALMGVEGSGARELLRSFAGLERCSGSIRIAGAAGAAAMFRRTAYVPATRQLSLYSNFSVGENLVARLGVPEIAAPTMALRRKQIRRIAAEAVRRFLVKTRNLTESIRALSGGNQQKVAIAQALVCDPRVILLEEPTRGVDVQSKREIYRLLRDFARAGNAAVLFCTEVLEIFEVADRVVVVSEGRLSRSLPVRDYDQIEKLATDITRLERHSRVARSDQGAVAVGHR
jgi:ABC-type sugar transport system ATPase subunit